MDAPRDANQAAEPGPATAETGPANTETRSANTSQLRSIATLVLLDIAAPLAAYSWLQSAGLSTVTALLISGVFPAAGLVFNAVRHGRLEVVGALVLAGIVVGSVLGLISHNPRLVLVEGSVPTGVIGLACLGSLGARRPLMFSFMLEFTGPGSAKGREMTKLWRYERFRHIFRVITAVWGLGFLLEAALRVVIIYSTSTGTALVTSSAMPIIWTGALSAWTVGYGAYQRKRGERLGHVVPPEESSPVDGTVKAGEYG